MTRAGDVNRTCVQRANAPLGQQHHHLLGVPKVLLFWPKEKLVLEAVEPNRPVGAVDVTVAAPNKLPVPAAIGLVGPFLPAW